MFIIVCLLAVSPLAPSVSIGADPATAHTPAFNSSDSLIGDLIDNSATRAILDKYIPGFSTSDQIDAARNMTLKAIQQFAPEAITDDILAKIDADLAKLSPAK